MQACNSFSTSRKCALFDNTLIHLVYILVLDFERINLISNHPKEFTNNPWFYIHSIMFQSRGKSTFDLKVNLNQSQQIMILHQHSKEILMFYAFI